MGTAAAQREPMQAEGGWAAGEESQCRCPPLAFVLAGYCLILLNTVSWSEFIMGMVERIFFVSNIFF